MTATASLVDRARVLVRRLPFLRDVLRVWLAPAWRRRLVAAEQRRSAQYPEWAARHATSSAEERSAIRQTIEALAERPVISLLMPLTNPSLAQLDAAISAVEAQLWPDWDLSLIIDAATTQPTARDSRIHLIQEPTAALAFAKGQWIGVLDPACLLTPEALYELAIAASAHPEATLIYSDEDRIGPDGKRHSPHFKPTFDPDLFLSQTTLGDIALYRTEALHLDGSNIRESLLRYVARIKPDHALHVPKILCHRRDDATAGTSAEDRAAALANAGHEVTPATRPHWPRPDPEPRVSIIIPTRDCSDLLAACLDSILQRTDYTNLEILICDNNSVEPATATLFQRLATDPRVRILPMFGPFNYSRLNNQAAREATGDILLLLNNDTEAIDSGWLTEMVSLACRPEIGAVGAKLLYPDDTLQHGGVVLGIGWPGGVAGHFMPHAAPGDTDPSGWLRSVRTVSAVTAACLAVRRSVYDEVGGLNETDLTVAFNDVDFCLRLQVAGYRNLWTPFAELYHKESASRGSDITGPRARRMEKEVAWMRQRWGKLLDNDPFWNPNLSLVDGRPGLARQPRDRRARTIRTWSDP
jgi:O-antigen biosynthesis protein